MATTCLSTQSDIEHYRLHSWSHTFVLVNASRQPVDDKLIHFVTVVVHRAEPCALHKFISQSYSTTFSIPT